MKKEKGITLIALVITIIVLLILSGVVILSIVNGPIKKAQKAAVQTELKAIEEKIELYKTSKVMESDDFDVNSLYADENELRYNTKSEEETGNIYTIVPEAEKKYKGKIYIEKGEMVFNSEDTDELKWAEDIGIATTGTVIDKEGTLLCVNEVETLIDENGVLRIPERVKKISAGAFNGINVNVKKIVIPGTCKKIESNVFNGQKQIEEVIIEEGVETLGSYIFRGCSNLKTIKLPNSVTSIGGGMFFNCENLTELEFFNNVKSIPSETFYNCFNLKTVGLSNNITTIGTLAFGSCTNLESLYISDKVINIENNALGSSNKLVLTVSEDNPQYKMIGNTLITKDGTKIIYICQGENLKEYSIPEGVTEIGNIFSTCSNLEKIIIPESLKTISYPTFTYLKKLNNIELNESNQNFSSDGKALYNKDETTLIRYYAQDESYKIKSTVTILGKYCFAQNKYIKNITLPEGLNTIENQAFSSTNISNIKIGRNVSSLGGLSLYAIGSSTNVTIDPENLNYKIENNMLFNYEKTMLIDALKNEETIVIPDGVEEIGSYAFHNNYNLKNVTIPSTVKKINGSFQFCSSLERIEIPSSVISIASGCFSNTNIKEIIVHNKQGGITDAPWGAAAGIKVVKWIGVN